MTCPNCDSHLHARCCARCGRRMHADWLDEEFCSRACAALQQHADKMSYQIELDEQAARRRVTRRTKQDRIDELRGALRDAIQWITDRSSEDSLLVGRLQRVLDECG